MNEDNFPEWVICHSCTNKVYIGESEVYEPYSKYFCSEKCLQLYDIEEIIKGRDPVKVLWYRFAEWSDKTFQTGPEGPLNHLKKKEVDEALNKPNDIVEYADCMLLILDATRRAGFTYQELVKACFEKLEINKTRKWGPKNADGFSEHIREEE